MTDITHNAELAIAQYQEAPKFMALLRGFLRILQEETVDFLDLIADSADIDKAQGVALDWLGERVGLVRPRIEDPNAFGFDKAGTGFDRGRFESLYIVYGALLPLSDSWYRRILRARVLFLHSGVSVNDVNAIINLLFDDGYVIDANTSGEARNAVTYSVRESHLRFFRLVDEDEGLRDRIIPRRPGTTVTMTRRTT